MKRDHWKKRSLFYGHFLTAVKAFKIERELHHCLTTLKVFNPEKRRHHCLKGFNTEKGLHHLLMTLKVFNIEKELHDILEALKGFNFEKWLSQILITRKGLSTNNFCQVLLTIADKKTYENGFSILVPWSEGRGRFAKLTRWPEPRALVEKNRTSPLPYHFVAARWTVFLKLLFQSYEYQ